MTHKRGEFAPPLSAQSHRVLSSVVELTGERSFEDIRESLVKTLFEMLPARRLTVLKVSKAVDGYYLSQLFSVQVRQEDRALLAAGFGDRGMQPDATQAQAIASQDVARDETAPGLRQVLPVLAKGKLLELFDVELERGDEVSLATLGALIRLYTNILDLLFEKELDGLTGILNRRAFDAQLDALLRQSFTVPGRPLRAKHESRWLALIDIDHFKAINDNFGHVIGDEVLLLLAQMLQQLIRSTDEIYRYGGEEFAMISGPASHSDAYAVLERLRQKVEARRFPQVGQVTLSIGWVEIGHYDLASSLIGKADQALYYAKASGRNMVCSYAELLAAGKIVASKRDHEIELF